MLAGWLVLMLAQQGSCGPQAADLMAVGRSLSSNVDLAGAAGRFEEAASLGCAEARAIAVYLRALHAAREAYRSGGDAASLAPVNSAIAELERPAGAMSPAALAVMRAVLMAAAAAAQSERDTMQLLLTHALDVERGQLSPSEARAAGITAHEVAGDLWLQVHRFAEAAAAYTEAQRLLGEATVRILLGRARASARLDDSAAACSAYGALYSRDAGWPPADVSAEVRQYINAHACPIR